MANRGYDVVVDVDDEDLGTTDLQEDLEFHNSNFDTSGPKIQPDSGSRSTGNPFLSSGSSATPKRPMLALSFYTQFFDVDTNEVLRRCWAALYPRAPFLDVIDGNPDLYGPFWIATTVVFILFLAGTLNLRMGGPTDDGFNWGLLSGASGLIYGYTGVIPIGLWATLRWFGSESANLLECWCLYGYANIVWIVVAAISWSRIDILNFIFVALGFAVSAVFLVRNLYPVLSATDIKTSKILLIVMVVLHAGLAIAIKVLFFAHGSPVAKTPPTNEAPTPLDPPPTEGGSRFML